MNQAMVLVLGVIAALTSIVASADTSTLSIPREGKSLTSFVPDGYEIAQEIHGDFDRDGLEDIAVMLWTNKESFEVRPFLVLLHKSDGRYLLALRADNLLRQDPAGCGAANVYCVPTLETDRGTLKTTLGRGAAGSSSSYVAEYQLIGNDWFLVGDTSYDRSLYNLCQGQQIPKLRSRERCFESGIKTNYISGVQTEYWVIVQGDEATNERTQFIDKKIRKKKLVRLIDLDREIAQQLISPNHAPAARVR